MKKYCYSISFTRRYGKNTKEVKAKVLLELKQEYIPIFQLIRLILVNKYS